ncbi:MAG: DUF4395 domain-containing protein [candidate division Zixibacteria bacterium]|nr:DUF4395 domain-containing protein [candidate division Zixibacteria bacterium]
MNNNIISSVSRCRLEEQGYRGFTEAELSQHRFGIRMAYVVCMSLVIIGMVFKSQTFLLIANGIAFLGMLPPFHPIDYLYNYGFRFLLGRPKLPHRANQGRFACIMATGMLGVMNYYLYLGNLTVVYIVGASLLGSAFLVSFLDLCIPSKIYNAFSRIAIGQIKKKISRPGQI